MSVDRFVVRHCSLVILSSVLAFSACSRDSEPPDAHNTMAPTTAPAPQADHTAPATSTAAADMSPTSHEIHWSYAGTGAPEYWGTLKEEFATCALGKKQSPIDVSGVTVTALPALNTQYKDVPLQVVNNGHTIQVNYAPGSTLTLEGKPYELAQFHFHSPSEHTIGGKSTDMVAHFVHKAADGELAVIETQMTAGQEQSLIKSIWENLPRSGETRDSADTKINAAQLLPDNRSEYFHYIGSLTTPPCTEGVRWFVLANPIQVSAEQIATFRNLFPMNARPVQAVSGRPVLAAN